MAISCISKSDLTTALNGLQAKIKEWQTKQLAAKVEGAAEACKASVDAAMVRCALFTIHISDAPLF